jgi:hypothetical protein
VIFTSFDECRGRALGLMLTGAVLSAIARPSVAQLLIRSIAWRVP